MLRAVFARSAASGADVRAVRLGRRVSAAARRGAAMDSGGGGLCRAVVQCLCPWSSAEHRWGAGWSVQTVAKAAGETPGGGAAAVVGT